MASEAVSLITIRGNPVGLTQLESQARAVVRVQGDLVVASEKVERRNLSVENSLRRLQRQYDEGFRAQEQMARATRTLDRALEQGLITEQRRAELLGLASERINKAVVANDNLAKSSRASAYQIQQLGFQLNDVAASLASGASPFTVLLQQGGQIQQALDGPGGVGAGIRNVGTYLKGLVTPATVAGVALVGAAGAATLAWSRYDDQQKLIGTTLAGLGARVGLTVRQFEQMAQAAAVAGGVSVRQATDLGVAYARTGTLGADNIQRLIGLTKNFAATVGTDVEGAKQELSSLFSDPAAGIEKLQRQFAFLDGQTRGHIESLLRQGRAQEAVRIALDKLPGSLANYNQSLGRISSAWEFLKGKISDADRAVGEFFNRVMNTSPVEDRIKALERRISDLKQVAELPLAPGSAPRGYAYDSFGGSATQRSTAPLPPQRPRELQSLERQREMDLAALRRGMENLANERLNQELVERAEAVRKIAKELGPANSEYQKYIDWEKALRDAVNSTDPEFKRQIGNINEVKDLLEKVSNARSTYLSEEQRAVQQRQIDIDSEGAVTSEQRRAIEVRQERLNQAGKLISAAEAEAAARHRNTLGLERETALLRAMLRDQQMQAEAIQLERDMLFASDQARAAVIAGLRAEQELKRQGIGTSGELAQKYIEEAKVNAARAAELQKQRQLFEDLKSIGVNAFTSIAQAIASGEKPLKAFEKSLTQIGNALISGGINQIASGNFVTGGVMAASGFIASAIGAGSDRRAQQREQRIAEWTRQQEQAQQTLEEAQRRQAEATLEAARATAAAQAEAARIAEEAQRQADAVTQRYLAYQDRTFAAGLDTGTLQGRLAAFDRRAQREREEELRQGGHVLAQLEQALAAERLQIQRDFQREAIEEQRRYFETIRSYLDSLKVGNLTTLSPAERAAEAERQYAEAFARARAGDTEARSGLTGLASRYLEEQRSFYGPSAQYASAFERVNRELSGLAGLSSMGLTAANSNVPTPVLPAAATTGGPAAIAAAMPDIGGPVVAALAALQREVTALRAVVAQMSGQEVAATNNVKAAVEGLRSDVRLNGQEIAIRSKSAA